jgi:hypothetical protein
MLRSGPRQLALGLALAALAPGCSISHSVESLSDSVSSPFESSSDSSGGEEDAAYRDEVSGFAAGFAASGGDATAFRRGVASIAERRGIHDWEDDDPTCRAIGAGLQRARLGEDRAEDVADDLLAGRSERVKVVMLGFATAD